ncbi:phosphopantetheine-binding protein [Vibrio sp. Of7-15]|uniref:phosphopantetheine-binding protein n=1 Tax=Vibrio sp. Of7-15 TaxID=2724879 RepID=UPI001EF2AF16|nr:phosphopantetheine-binding protein [Vibrio sp. Of7-15]MCG7495633.1 phosphopantetheine-binding protein [Vibrio sp. Of7-15]
MVFSEADSRNKIYMFIENNMNVFDEDVEFDDETNIFESGYVNSTFAMRLLNFIENEFGLIVPDEEIAIHNFSSVSAMWQMMVRLKEVQHESQ